MTALALSALPLNRRATIHVIEPDEGPNCIDLRLYEMGLAEGMEIMVRHRAPFGGDPITVAVGNVLIAMRLAEADRVRVIPTPDP